MSRGYARLDALSVGLDQLCMHNVGDTIPMSDALSARLDQLCMHNVDDAIPHQSSVVGSLIEVLLRTV
jgi:hypothetical protein